MWGAMQMPPSILNIHCYFNPRTRVGYDRALLPRSWPHWFSRCSKYPTGYRTSITGPLLNVKGPVTRVGCDALLSASIFVLTSIHAPVLGATYEAYPNTDRAFQSTHPCGVRQALFNLHFDLFQSTHLCGVRHAY